MPNILPLVRPDANSIYGPRETCRRDTLEKDLSHYECASRGFRAKCCGYLHVPASRYTIKVCATGGARTLNGMNSHTSHMKRVTASLPDELVHRLKQLSDESGLKVSAIIARAVSEHLGLHSETPVTSQAPMHPTVLWKLKGRTYPRGPSPTLRRVRPGSWRVLELDKVSI